MMRRFKHGSTVLSLAFVTGAALAFCNAGACETQAETRARAETAPSTTHISRAHPRKAWAAKSASCCKHGSSKSAATSNACAITTASAPAKAAPAEAVAVARTTPVAPMQSGMVVAIDPETGILGMPTPEQMRRLFPLGVAAIGQTDAGLPILRGPGNAVGLDLQGRFQEYYVVRIGPDGRKVALCVDDPTTIRKALATPPDAAPVSTPATGRYEER